MKYLDLIDETWEPLFDSIKCGLLLLNAELEIIYVNSEYEKITGLSRHELIGRTSYYMVQNKLASFSMGEKIRRSLQPSSQMQTFSNKKTVLISGQPVMESGSLKIIVLTVNDITAESRLYKKLEEEKEKADAYRRSFEQTLTKGISQAGPAMQKVIKTALKTAQSSSSVLLNGETGVGKEVIANLIHNASARSQRPLIKVNCAAIPHELAESEFFGYVEGAFTGARSGGAAGVFELANHGTVFLDEVGELSLPIQSKLLRILQEQEATPLGGRNKCKKLNFRVIAATNQPLMKLITEGKFRTDLYYRLKVINITIPPLREHPEDIAPLVAWKMDKLIAEHHISKVFSKEALAFIEAYHWPGNVRELENTIEYLFFLTDNNCIDINDVADALGPHSKEELSSAAPGNLKNIIQKNERTVLREAMQKFSTMREAALHLGIDPATMTRKCKKYNIKPAQ